MKNINLVKCTEGRKVRACSAAEDEQDDEEGIAAVDKP